MMMRGNRFLCLFLGSISLLLSACNDGKLGSGGGLLTAESLKTPNTPLTIQETKDLIGGPAAQGRVGDVLLSNSRIRVIIQKPSKESGIGSFGGNIIDADHVRGGEGKDQWGEIFPMVNVEWSVNYYTYEVIQDGKDGKGQVLRAYGTIDVYEYLDLDWIADAASSAIGQQLTFDDSFDDRRDPFKIDPSLKDLSTDVITEYKLGPENNYVQIETTFTNPSDHPIAFPVGDFLAGGGELQLLVPGIGFAPPILSQASQNTPAVIYAAFEEGDLSYGYFYEMEPNRKPKEEEGAIDELYMTGAVTQSGLTGILLGEEFLKVLPVGSNASPEVHFTVPEKSSKTITRYFVIGDGTAGSVLDTGLKILNIPTAKISGKIISGKQTPVGGATIAVKKLKGGTLVTYRSDPFGKFEGLLPTGKGLAGRAFGEGKYEVWIEKKGYHENATTQAGSCQPAEIDITKGNDAVVECALGETGVVTLNSGVIDSASALPTPARLTIVGEDPSPETKGEGTFSDTDVFHKPFGIVDVKLINAKGGIGLTSKKSFFLEPGNYLFVFSKGPEYSIVEREVEVKAGGETQIEEVVLDRVVKTPGFISGDFHIHALPSPDSAISVERRALAAFADGLDVLHSSDHDFLTDYSLAVAKLSEKGWVRSNEIQTVVGDEITPNHYGHLHAFPLVPDFDDVDHGALDWSAHPQDEISPAPDYVMSPGQIMEALLLDPGEEVLQINHISEGPLSLLVAAGWLTTPIYQEKYGVSAFVSYADPIERRLQAPSNRPPMPPFDMENSGLIIDNFTAVELSIGTSIYDSELLWGSSLPTWFNLLNLGLMPTATASSDSHHEINTPLGFPRNYVVSLIDPRDGLGNSFDEIDEEIYANNINNRKVVVSAGPFISLKATNEKGERVGVGDVISGRSITLDIKVESPQWAWFDTIEVYANTEPLPAEDSGRFPLRNEAEKPSSFASSYHLPHYVYDAVMRFKVLDESLKDWKVENGKIRSRLQVKINVSEDTWVVVVARGTPETPGYRSLFPVVPNVLVNPEEPPSSFDIAQMEAFHSDKKVGTPAWAFTNPIFVDVDGDADNDGFPFEAKWVREGFSNLKPFRQ